MMHRATGRSDKELEIDVFIKTQMKVRAALKVLFTKTERFLLQN